MGPRGLRVRKLLEGAPLGLVGTVVNGSSRPGRIKLSVAKSSRFCREADTDI